MPYKGICVQSPVTWRQGGVREESLTGVNAVATHAMQVLRGLDQMRGCLDNLNGLRSGHVRIAAVQAVTELSPRALASLVERYPRVTFECVMPQLTAGDADIGITFQARADRHIKPAAVDRKRSV